MLATQFSNTGYNLTMFLNIKNIFQVGYMHVLCTQEDQLCKGVIEKLIVSKLIKKFLVFAFREGP